MPFIRGRYHMNPVVGHALESAREAEAALQLLEHAAKNGREPDDEEPGGNSAGAGRGAGQSTGGPIHRVEIEAAELVPSHSGRAQKGFVARVHRRVASGADTSDGSCGRSFAPSAGSAPQSSAETHVFADHGDLTNFLKDEFKKDAKEWRERRRERC